MSKAMTKTEIIKHLSGKSGITKRAAGQLLDDLAVLAHREAKNTFTLSGIGKLVVVNRKARMGRNPQTAESIRIPAKRVVKFRIAKACKDAALIRRAKLGASSVGGLGGDEGTKDDD
jgi:DNA-binding protein HU-beta